VAAVAKRSTYGSTEGYYCDPTPKYAIRRRSSCDRVAVRAFGFEAQLVVPGAGGTVAHAQFVFGHGMIMLGSAGAHGGDYDALVSTPAQAGTNTQSAYVIVEDADAHYAGAKAAGAEMALDIQD